MVHSFYQNYFKKWLFILTLVIWEKTGFFPTKYMQTPPISFDPVFMDDAKCAETNEKSIFQFYFSSYRENSSKIGVIWLQKTTECDHNSKNKIGKILNLIFLPILHLSCTFEHFWKKNWNFFCSNVFSIIEKKKLVKDSPAPKTSRG